MCRQALLSALAGCSTRAGSRPSYADLFHHQCILQVFFVAQFASFQEEIVHKFSENILGEQKLFCPDIYGDSKEPADIAWVTNRCAILMYMTESKKSFERKRDHNLKQLWRWLHVWKNGTPLIGISNTKRFEINFDDIDHIVGLSIIDGGETKCQYHSDIIRRSTNLKLSGCATITSSVIREMASTGHGPRDIIFWLQEMRFLTFEQQM